MIGRKDILSLGRVGALRLILLPFYLLPISGQGAVHVVERGQEISQNAQWYGIDEVVVVTSERVVVLDERGSSVEAVGSVYAEPVRISRSGDGPGEVRHPSNIGFLHDSIWIADSRSRQFVILPLVRGPGRTVPIDPPRGRAPPGAVWLPVSLMKGGYSLWSLQRPMTIRASDLLADGFSQKTMPSSIQPTLWIVNADGRAFALTALGYSLPARLWFEDGQRTRTTTNPFPIKDWFSSFRTSGGIAVVRDRPNSHGGKVNVEVYQEDGVLIWSREISDPDRPQPSDRAWIRLLDQHGASSRSPESRSALLKALRANGWPHVSRVLAARDGAVWIRRVLPRTQATQNDYEEWLRVTPGLEVPKRIQLPNACTLMEADTTDVWMACDPDSAPVIVHGTIPRF